MPRSAPRIRSYRARVENIEIAWIPLSDGRCLAARLVLPKDALSRPVPAILEYIPYRRRDGTRARDEGTMYWFAGNGYASARVDISGSGDSDGITKDKVFSIVEDKPASARANIDWQFAYQRDSWDVKVQTSTEMTCDEKYIYLTASVSAFDKGKRFCQRHFKKRFRRDNL